MSARDWGSKEYRNWKKAVLARDGRRCKMPGCEATKQLEAHHIKPYLDNPALRYYRENGITLCKACHSKISKNEDQYEELFTGLIKSFDLASLMVGLYTASP